MSCPPAERIVSQFERFPKTNLGLLKVMDGRSLDVFKKDALAHVAVRREL